MWMNLYHLPWLFNGGKMANERFNEPLLFLFLEFSLRCIDVVLIELSLPFIIFLGFLWHCAFTHNSLC